MLLDFVKKEKRKGTRINTGKDSKVSSITLVIQIFSFRGQDVSMLAKRDMEREREREGEIE